jgi:hypothetical protein
MSDRIVTLKDGTEVSVHGLARAITPVQFAHMMEDYVNVMGDGYKRGRDVGENLTYSHRTLQRSAILFFLGAIVGLSEQEHTDARNETAIETAQKIAQMVENGELPFGPFV